MSKKVQLGQRTAEPFRTPPARTPPTGPAVTGSFAPPPGSPAATALTAAKAQRPSTMPLQPGKVSRQQSLSPAERGVLEKLGWEEGDPIPPGLADRLAAAQRDANEALEDLQAPVPLNTPPLQVPPSVDIGSLPAQKQQELRDLVQNYKQAGEQPAPRGPSPGLLEAGPGILAAAEGQLDELEVVDDRQQPEASQTGEIEEHFCPRCRWDIRIADPIVPTIEDKQIFLQAVLGGIAFRKVYFLLGKQLEVRLRTLTPEELDLCWKQSALEFSQGKLATAMDRMNQALRYQCCLQITDVRTGDKQVALPESIQDYDVAGVPAGETPLPQIAAYVQEQALGTESRQRILSNTVMDFNRLVAKMEANAHTPDFWEAAVD